MNYAAIPTLYNGIQFRSRLEARWAAFFDLNGWPYEYEPLDLEGYIPDFALKFHRPLLVEVKPELTIDGLRQYANKLEATSWQGEFLLVGASLHEEKWAVPALGLLCERYDSSSFWWEKAVAMQCLCCEQPSFHHEQGSYECRVEGCHDGDRFLGRWEDLGRTWRLAGNLVQWRASQQ